MWVKCSVIAVSEVHSFTIKAMMVYGGWELIDIGEPQKPWYSSICHITSHHQFFSDQFEIEITFLKKCPISRWHEGKKGY